MQFIIVFFSISAIFAQESDSTLRDKGIFADLNPKAHLQYPTWISGEQITLVVDNKKSVAILVIDGLPIMAYPTVATDNNIPIAKKTLQTLRKQFGERLQIENPERIKWAVGDDDKDGIPNTIDVMLGARKTALNKANYKETYEKISYPNGDIPRTYGVCTDVIVRSMRNAGLDLQQEIYRDMKRRPKAYRVSKPDRNIEHRRVRRLLVYFKRYYQSLPVVFDAESTKQNKWLPGDIVLMDTFPSRSGPDHIGIISDQTNADGVPLVINNWTTGFHTQDMDLLTSIPVTHRYRLRLRK